MAIVVSDTSPIRALDHLDLLHLLPLLFDEILIPPAVATELEHPRPRFRAIPLTKMPFAHFQSPADHLSVTELRRFLDPGEAEAIALASERNANLLIDETDGRAEGLRRGLVVIGVLGLLFRAKARGLVPTVLPLAEQLRDELHFFVSQNLLAEVRRQAGED